MRLAHTRAFEVLRDPSPEDPWRVLFSGCLAGWRCGVDGTTNGVYPNIVALLALPTVQVIAFCPEQHTMGTPRTTPDLHGGDGFDVLDGEARVRDERGVDLTEAMIEGARAMVAHALAERAELAILMDMSGACGSQVISDGCRFDAERRYQRGVGVATAALLRAGVPVVSQRDHFTLGALRARLEPGYEPPNGALDHHETDWVRGYFADRS
ncbi:MAG: DUF523 domain-containing protein [Alphaproteobacteria bacterium]|nr:DUF523 domain-containing protein [Alphaproteobacteria bacterium]